jgi:beta-phosphoglucomutase-like phosphatase (HAD superfamily)
MFIIDFDDTIFDTRGKNGFKEARLKALRKIGVSRELYTKTYYKSARNSIGHAVYNSRRHARELVKNGFDEKKVFQALEKTVSARILKTFLYKDTIIFLKKLKKLKQPVILFSLGEKSFQILKINKTGLNKYFDKIIIVSLPKEKTIKTIPGLKYAKNVWFINNRVDETLSVKKYSSQFKYVLKQSADIPLEDYRKSGLPYFKNLLGIYEYIRKNQ